MSQLEQLKFEEFEAALISPFGGHCLTIVECCVAELLLAATSEKPVRNQDIMLYVQAETGTALSLRASMDVIRTLRRDHRFPILSRRHKPAGYWWCRDTAEMRAFIDDFRSQALDELTTLSGIVKHNYPALAGQLNLAD